MEIQTEAFGRVHVLHRWDRHSPPTDKASAWHRVVQPALSGAFLQPRVGWEALVGYRGAAGDEPYVIGRLYNGIALPPVALPANKVKSAFGSATTPGGGGANVVTTDDSAGREGMTFVASKDMRERTENDKKTSIAATDKHQVSGDRKLIVGQVHSVSVAGAQTHSVGASREVNVDANKGISAASESVTIGGARLFTVAGDYGTACASLGRLVGASKVETAIEHQARAVQGGSVVVVGATWKAVAGAHASVSVSGASTESVAGTKSITTAKYALAVRGALKETLASRTVSAGGDCIEDFGGVANYKVAGSAKLQGANVVVKAKSKLTIKAGGVTIEMTPGEVTVKGDFQGSVAAVDSGDQKYG
jgi:type VI secretion system secreted protein VgrG